MLQDFMIRRGQQIKSIVPIDRFPHFLFEAGETGVIEDVQRDQVTIRLDKPKEELKEWDNCIVYDVGQLDLKNVPEFPTVFSMVRAEWDQRIYSADEIATLKAPADARVARAVEEMRNAWQELIGSLWSRDTVSVRVDGKSSDFAGHAMEGENFRGSSSLLPGPHRTHSLKGHMNFLKNILPPGSKVYYVIIGVTGETKRVVYLAVVDGVPVNITHNIARALDLPVRQYNEKGHINTKDPGNLINTLASEMFGDYKGLNPQAIK